MLSAPSSFLAALDSLCKDQIQQAGQRYTPGLDPTAPNLRIAALSIAVNNVACGESALARFQTVLEEFSEAWRRAKHCSQRSGQIQPLVDAAVARLPEMMPRFRARDAVAGVEWQERLAEIDAKLMEDVVHWQAEEAKLGPDGGDYSTARNTIRGNMDSIGSCLRVIRDEAEYAASPSFKLLFDPVLMIGGEWGTGKTHLLCDFTSDRLVQGLPTALVLAKNFQGNALAEICARLEPSASVEDQFAKLADAGSGASGRALFIVDGVNEGRRREWRKAVTELLALAEVHPGIGVIVTCRTPFESIAIQQANLKKFHRLQHYGFDDQEFDAQAAFFQYYKLPLPEVPLLDREFSRPLTLKLICQSLQNLTGKKLAKGFAGIASGQRGMTYVLESFVNRVGEAIELKFGLPAKACWLLLKGGDQFTDKRIAGFAPCMAHQLRGYVLPSEADRIVAASYPALSRAQRRALLEELRTNGLVEEDAIWYSTASGQHRSRVVYRLPYQRFSDHLIARHLLKAYLDVSSAATIKLSFAATSPLGKIFQLSDRHFANYAEPGWAQALITEFPERVGARLPPEERELFFVLPKHAQDLNAYLDPFIEGLFWRSPTSFTEGTRRIVSSYLGAGTRTWERVVDALAALATKPKHPYDADRLYTFLARHPMVDRDLRWSEYLRRRYASQTIHRLLTWAEKLDTASMSQDSATALVVLFSLVLTTVVRSDRDLATKALVLIGERYPAVLFAHVVKSLEFNDPYVPERMLAAAYGTTLSLVDSGTSAWFRPVLGDLAQHLYRKMFAPRARHSTPHALMRDYALGIIELAKHADCVLLPKTSGRHLEAPFASTRSPFSSDGKPDEAVKEAIGHAIHMDFGNYTIGGLIPTRVNYDENKPDYVGVRAKIERRMFDLGYRADLFKNVDAEIGRGSWNARDEQKIDRYGKKYSWIAYFEMWGERAAKRRLPDWRQESRPADCGVDPSFPKRPPDWAAPIPELFGAPLASTEDWVNSGYTPDWKSLLVVPEINGIPGKWILVEGYVQGGDDTHDRELFAFLRGMFVARKHVAALKSKFLAIEYPGNRVIPEGASEHYLFGGEPGHRTNFAKHLLGRDGRYRRQVREAFEEYIRDYSAGKKSSVRIKLTPPSGAASDDLDDTVFEFEVPTTTRVPGVRLELPSIQYEWESYHSVHNTFSGFDLPAPSIIQRLGLFCKDREIDFYDASGRPATLYREAGGGWVGDRHKLLYIREDLLKRYLAETRQVLVWCNWGERDWFKKMEGSDLINNPARQRVFQKHSHIHRTFSQWVAKDCLVL